jgi:hypothetical protein
MALETERCIPFIFKEKHMYKNFKKKTLVAVLATAAVAALVGFGQVSLASTSKQRKHHTTPQKDIRALLPAVAKAASSKNVRSPKIKCFLIGYKYLCDRRTGNVIQTLEKAPLFDIADGWANVICESIGYYSPKGPFINRLSKNSKYAGYDGVPADSYLMHHVNGKWKFVDWFQGEEPITRARLYKDGLSDRTINKLNIDNLTVIR